MASLRGSLIGAWLGSSIIGCTPSDTPAQVVEPTLFEVTGVFQTSRLDESSGVAASRALEGVLWTHNDSGDDPVLYAVDATGALLASYLLSGAEAVDWEDVAIGRCPQSIGTCIYVADTGDNSSSRPHADIYIVEEPESLPPPGADAEPLQARRLRLRYPDGAQDVEALAVAPSGALLLFSKGRNGTIGVYRVSASDVMHDSVVAERVQQLDIVPQRGFGRQVTGAAISPSGRHVVVRTYIELAFYQLTPDERLVEGPKCLIAGRELQGEAVDFVDDSTLVLTSEALLGRPGTISRVQCPFQ
ncbi:MAG: hypothetical protein PVH40_04185 [Gemmatimonadales bacterium]